MKEQPRFETESGIVIQTITIERDDHEYLGKRRCWLYEVGNKEDPFTLPFSTVKKNLSTESWRRIGKREPYTEGEDAN